MNKIVTILGARPQFIKSVLLTKTILEFSEFTEVVVHTGQHYDKNLSDIFFNEFNLKVPDYNLGINSFSHGKMTGRMIEAIEEILFIEKPKLVLVYGDTNSTLAGAIAAKKLENILLAHVESGLRSFDNRMPEEINRILTDRISDLLFCPTKKAIDNLIDEGYEKHQCSLFNVGDIMYDNILFFESKLSVNCDFSLEEKYVLVTIHREENVIDNERLINIINSLNEIAETCKVIFPIHPRTRFKIKENSLIMHKNIDLIGPVGYLKMLGLIKNSQLVITDSGGLQKEAFFFNKYCIVLRDSSEWQELVEIGNAKLVGSDSKRILQTYNTIKNLKYTSNSKPFGLGDAHMRIYKKIKEVLI